MPERVLFEVSARRAKKLSFLVYSMSKQQQRLKAAPTSGLMQPLENTEFVRQLHNAGCRVRRATPVDSGHGVPVPGG